MTGNYFVTTDDLSIVYGHNGPLLRFSLTAGIIETGGQERQLLVKFEGCIGRTTFDRDPVTNEVIATTTTFVWSPPATRIGPKLVQVITVTPHLYDAVMESLQSQGAIEAYKNKVAQFAITKLPTKEVLKDVQTVGTYVFG